MELVGDAELSDFYCHMSLSYLLSVDQILFCIKENLVGIT
jgi:hypothetical protein